MAQRQDRVLAKAVPNARAARLMPHVRKKVLPESVIYTDEYAVYDRLNGDGYRYSRVHHAADVYVAEEVHTKTMEGFWSLVKRGICGVYHSVSSKHLQSYLAEYAFRCNHRKYARPMFLTMLSRVSVPSE